MQMFRPQSKRIQLIKRSDRSIKRNRNAASDFFFFSRLLLLLLKNVLTLTTCEAVSRGTVARFHVADPRFLARDKNTAEWQFCPHWVVVETNWYDKKHKVSLSTGVDFAVVPSADRANVVYRDLYGCHGGYFEALFTFVVGVVSLSRKVCAFGLHKNILTLSL